MYNPIFRLPRNMKIVILVSILLLVSSGSPQPPGSKGAKGSAQQSVKHLTAPSVDPLLVKYPNLIILFMKEHKLCQKVDEAYRNIASTLSAKHSLAFYVAMYDQNPSVFSKLGIDVVPEIILYKDGKRLDCDYTGIYQHSEEQLTRWIEEKFSNTLPRIDKLEAGNVSRVIDVGCKREQEILPISLSDNHNEYYCSSSVLGNHSEGKLILRTPTQTFQYDNSLPVLEWIRTYQDGYLKPLTDYYIHKIFNSNQSHVILLTHFDNNSAEVLPLFQQYARKHTNSTLSFIHSHIDGNIQLQVETVNFVGFTPQFPYPHLSLITANGGQIEKYYPGAIDKSNITEWLDNALSLQEPPYIKNTDYEQKEQPSSFSSIGHNQLMLITALAQKKSPIFVYFYSQYCEECVLRLGDLKHDLAIPKHDAKHYYKYSVTDNDIPFFVEMESVPTLIYQGEDGNILYLEEEHTVVNMVGFVRKNNHSIVNRKIKKGKEPKVQKETKEDIKDEQL